MELFEDEGREASSEISRGGATFKLGGSMAIQVFGNPKLRATWQISALMRKDRKRELQNNKI